MRFGSRPRGPRGEEISSSARGGKCGNAVSCYPYAEIGIPEGCVQRLAGFTPSSLTILHFDCARAVRSGECL